MTTLQQQCGCTSVNGSTTTKAIPTTAPTAGASTATPTTTRAPTNASTAASTTTRAPTTVRSTTAASTTTTKAPPPNPIMPKSCADVKAMGALHTGFYMVATTVAYNDKIQVIWSVHNHLSF